MVDSHSPVNQHIYHQLEIQVCLWTSPPNQATNRLSLPGSLTNNVVSRHILIPSMCYTLYFYSKVSQRKEIIDIKKTEGKYSVFLCNSRTYIHNTHVCMCTLVWCLLPQHPVRPTLVCTPEGASTLDSLLTSQLLEKQPTVRSMCPTGSPMRRECPLIPHTGQIRDGCRASEHSGWDPALIITCLADGPECCRRDAP